MFSALCQGLSVFFDKEKEKAIIFIASSFGLASVKNHTDRFVTHIVLNKTVLFFMLLYQ